MQQKITKNLQYYKFCLYGFFKNLRFFDAFLLVFLMDNGLKFSLIGVLYAIREITLAIFEIPSGVIADAMGRRKTLVSSFLLYILSFILFYSADQFGLFVVAMIFFAFGDAFRSGVHKAMIYHYLAKNNWGHLKITYYGHTRSWSQFGSAISALAAGMVVFVSGDYAFIFLASIVPYLVDMILVWSYPKYLDGDQQSNKNQKLRDRFIEITKAFFNSFKKLRFVRALTSLSIYTGFYRAVKDYFQPLLKYFALSLPLLAYLENEKKTAIFIGVFYFFTFLATSLASRKAGFLASRFSSAIKPMNLTIISGFLVGIATGIAFNYGYFVIAIIGFISLLIIENLRKPITVSVVADLTKEKAMATVLSSGSQAKSVIAAVIAPLIGLIADFFNPGTAIASISVLLLLTFPFYWLKANRSVQ